jgi:hypothetical protein
MSSEDCDSEVFKNGDAICCFHARSTPTEEWVQKVAAESGQRVDWHYSGGYANVLFLGDYEKVCAAVEKLRPELAAINAVGFRLFAPASRGLYRAGDLLPGDVVGVDNS